MGLRVNEIIALKITDIDSKAMQVFIERAKGKKDRYANLPESVLEQLRAYFLEYRPKKYLFEGQCGDQYSSRSAQKVFKEALRKAKITLYPTKNQWRKPVCLNGRNLRLESNSKC